MSAVVTILSPTEAQRLTQRIKLTASTIRDNLFKLRNYVDEAKNSNVWQILGYPSWTAYLADTLAEEPMRLGREERQELVGYLSGEGLSSSAIGPIIGVTDRRARQLVSEVGNDFRPEPPTEPAASAAPATPMPVSQVREALGDDVANAYEKVDWTPPPPVAKPIVGLDGKQYSRPEPQPTRRASLMDEVNSVERSLFKDLEKLRAIVADDRFAKNKASIQDALRPIAGPIREILADLFTDQSLED